MELIKWLNSSWSNRGYVVAHLMIVCMWIAALQPSSIESYSSTPAIWLAIGGISVIGFTIGLPYHMILTYKASKK